MSDTGSPLAHLLGQVVPGLLQSLGLPAIPITPAMVAEIRALAGKKDSEDVGTWEAIAHLKLISSVTDEEFRDLVTEVLTDRRYSGFSLQLMRAMVQVGREKALAHKG